MKAHKSQIFARKKLTKYWNLAYWSQGGSLSTRAKMPIIFFSKA